MKGTLYTGGTIYTMEPGVSVAEAVLVENGRIQAVGKRAELEKDAEKVVDLEGKTMLPAFIDSKRYASGRFGRGFLFCGSERTDRKFHPRKSGAGREMGACERHQSRKSEREAFAGKSISGWNHRGTSTAHSAYFWSFRCTQFHGTGRIGHYG